MAKKENKEVGLAVSADAKTSEILNILDEKLKGLKRVEEAVYKTSGNIDGVPDIKNETKIDILILAMGVVIKREEAYNAGQDRLKRSTAPVYKINGYTVAEWEHDINLRLDVLEYDSTVKKLKSYKEKMTGFLSQQEQKQMLIDEMVKEFGVAE